MMQDAEPGGDGAKLQRPDGPCVAVAINATLKRKNLKATFVNAGRDWRERNRKISEHTRG